MTTTGAVTVDIDGRRARRERGRAAVVDAAFDILQQGVVPPPVDEVARRSGVSVSTIFRYFDGLDDLQHQALGRFRERFAPLLEIARDGDGSPPSRTAAFVEARLALYDAAGVIMALGRLRGLEHPPLAAAMAEFAERLTAQVTSQFAPELDAATSARRDDLVAVIDSLTSPQAWDVMRNRHRRTRTQIRRAWIRALTTLLTDTEAIT
jgi:AcrR family transcriptional regulator